MPTDVAPLNFAEVLRADVTRAKCLDFLVAVVRVDHKATERDGVGTLQQAQRDMRSREWSRENRRLPVWV